MTLPDAAARAEAVDPLVSCCVSAPAGSGKTELLIQRFLALLSRVETPESVVAITFTRKAAAEMRARLVTALESAAESDPVAGEHAQRTRDLALAALAADSRHEWNLIANPARLRIQTIDSFCGELVRQMPLLSGSGGELPRRDDAEELYREAVAAFLRDAARAGSAELRTLLLHLDNDGDAVVELLTRLLARRDQWQRLLGAGGVDEAERARFETTVAELVTDTLGRLSEMLGAHIHELEALMAYRDDVLGHSPPFQAVPASLENWRRAADALLTNKNDWRSRVDRRQGFPADSEEQKQRKAAMHQLLETLADAGDGLLSTLVLLRRLPEPRADQRHWEALQALLALLPQLSAQLLLVFRRRGEVDHGQVALAAITALGEDDAPTDISMRLDYRIEHLLVDEFQDTSSGQFELLRRLTRGWEEHNAAQPARPRTLMVVGDAMQSIYGFRQANVGLFIEARNHGIGGLALEPLDLSVNFRSSCSIVEWVNRTFKDVLPARDDAQSGAVAYRDAVPMLPASAAPSLQLFDDTDERLAEAAWICGEIARGLDSGEVRSIAILGRSRRSLEPTLAALRAAGIAYAGRDLDPLADRMVVRDLLTLCEVLHDPLDRYGWLALLRGPWAALEHRDLLAVSLHGPTAAALLGEAQLPAPLREALTDGASERLGAVLGVLNWAMAYRDRLALRVWVEETWLRLGGAAAHPAAENRGDAEQFLQLVEELEQDGGGLDLPQLRARVEKLYAGAVDDRSPVQVMTLHRAKGLEFDWVFIPALQRGTANNQPELLLWDELVLPSGEPAFLLDIRSAADASDGQRVYDYLKDRHREKRRLEDARLLYVGCTRAASRLCLSGTLERDDDGVWNNPASGSLLRLLGDDLIAAAHAPDRSQDLREGKPRLGYRRLQSLPPLEQTGTPTPAAPLEMDSNRLPRALGTAIHRCAEALLLRAGLPQSVDDGLRTLLRIALAEEGCEPALLETYTRRGSDALERLLADPWARWALDPGRGERHAELPLTLLAPAEDDTGGAAASCRQLVIDYLFLDEEREDYWVVDYKTSVPAEGQSLDEFFAAESERYQAQLSSYARAVRAARGRHAKAVRTALYFVALGQHWEVHCEQAPSLT